MLSGRESAQYTGMPLRRALMERYSGVAWAVSEAEESGNIEWRMGW